MLGWLTDGLLVLALVEWLMIARLLWRDKTLNLVTDKASASKTNS